MKDWLIKAPRTLEHLLSHVDRVRYEPHVYKS